MQLPGFTAASVLPSRFAYGNTTAHRMQSDQVLVPALPPVYRPGEGGFKGFSGCIQDCMDEYPQLTNAQCVRSCRDAGVTDTGGSTDERINNALSRAGCEAWYIACRANPFGFFCDSIRDNCLSQIRS